MHKFDGRPVCIFISDFDFGGVERVMVNLARGLAFHGVHVDFITKRENGSYLDMLSGSVQLIKCGESPKNFLDEYIDSRCPKIILTAKYNDDKVALRLKEEKKRAKTRFFVHVGTNLSAMIKKSNILKQFIRFKTIRSVYSNADGIIAVSKGVALDLANVCGLPADIIHILPNPIITPELYDMSREPVVHPWFKAGEPPVILAVGGLRRVKDFPTLIRAFALVRMKRNCRLMILGEGRQRDALIKLVNELEVADDVLLPGFQENPYSFMAKSRVLVLSSVREGYPTVLVEALALGLPVISTDCDSGPSEILKDGLYGSLVPVGNFEVMANYIIESLDKNNKLVDQISIDKNHSMEIAAQKYMQLWNMS